MHDRLSEFNVSSLRAVLLRRAPDGPVTVLEGDDRVLVQWGAFHYRAIAYTPTQVLIEQVYAHDYYVRWAPADSVRRLEPDEEWKGYPLPD